jgi:hypothetical protein
MHRLIIGAKQGDFVDHINMDSLDNRRSNLRIVTRGESQRNTRPAKGRDVKGVYAIRRKGRSLRWRAEYWMDGKHRYLGQYENREDAVKVVKIFARENGFRCDVPSLIVRTPVKTERRRCITWSSSLKGICKCGEVWEVRKIIGGKRVYFGRYSSEREAKKAWRLEKNIGGKKTGRPKGSVIGDAKQ